MSTRTFQTSAEPNVGEAVNRALVVAAALSTLTLGVHVAAGTPDILDPVLASNAPAVARETIRVCWHLISLTLLAMAGSYAYGSTRRDPALTFTWTMLAAAFGVVFAAVAVSSGLVFGELPQSAAFFAIADAGAVGLWRSPTRG